VAYWLLSGHTLFDSSDVPDLLEGHLHSTPKVPSVRLGKPVDPELESIIMRCLAKDPALRPANAEALEEALAACASARSWTQEAAAKWWDERMVSLEPAPIATVAEKTLIIANRS
jgi:eukaryotic-like serine/threonine-protein kinase